MELKTDRKEMTAGDLKGLIDLPNPSQIKKTI